MASYFDAKNAAHLKMLPPQFRTSPELENAAAEAEADVISAFTEAPPYQAYTAGDLLSRTGIVLPTALLGGAELAGGEDISNTGAPSGATVPALRVYLAGYKQDSADANVDPNLKVALRRTIAAVVRWRLAGWNREQGVASASDYQAKSRSFRDDADDDFPPNWDWRLVPYMTRPRSWAT